MEVFSFGNGDFLFQIFSAVVGMMGDGSFSTLIRIALILGFLFLAYQLLFSMNIVHISKRMVSHYIFVVVMVGVMFAPKTDVVIRDEIKNTQVTVQNVPYGVGLFAHVFTTVEKGLTRIMENYFSTPADMRFNQSGYAFSVMLLDSFKDAVPKNPYFKQTLDTYMENCFFHDVLWGDKDLQTVVFSNNLWNELNPENSANKYTKIYSQSYPAGEGVTCNAAYAHLTSSLGPISTDALDALNKVMQVNVAASTPVIFNYLLGVSMSANAAITQAIAANAVKSSFARTAMYTGEGAGAIPYASGLAEQTQRSSWTVAGDLSKKYIPIMRQVLEAFVYGLFPLLFIMMLTPLGGKYFSLYITLLTWLLLWSPLFAIINLIVNVRANGVLSASYGYFSIGSMPYVYQAASELTAMAGYMAWMVPTIAFAIAKGSENAITSVASGVASSVSFTSKSAASNISSPTASSNIASHAGLLTATDTHGVDAMRGVAASKIFSIQQGMAASKVGMAATGQVANTEMSGRAIDAQQLEEIAKRHGLPNYQEAQKLMASDKYQQALTGAGARKAFAEDYAQKYNTTIEAGYRFLAESQMAQNRAIEGAWGGNVQAYTNFLKTGYELSAGQQKGVVAAAQAAGVSVGSYGEMTSFMEEMRKVGALDKFMSGQITAQDLRNMGAVGVLSEKGMAEAAQRIANETGMTVDQAKAHLATREGLNQFAKIEMRDKMNRMLGGDGSDGSYYDYVKGVHASDSKTLTQAEAQALNQSMHAGGYRNFNAQVGDKATFAFNPTTGQFTMAHTERGGRSGTYDLSMVRKGADIQAGHFEKTGRQIERMDVNRSTADYTTSVRTGSDVQHFDRNESTVSHGTVVSPATAYQMALEGNTALTAGAANSLTNAQRSAAVAAIAAPLGKAISEFISRSGTRIDFSKGSIDSELGVRMPSALPLKVGIGGRASVGVASDDIRQTNLINQQLTSVMYNALGDAKKQGLSESQTNQLMSQRLQQYTQGIEKQVRETSKNDFGASAPISDVKKAGSSALPYPHNKEEKLQKGQELTDSWKEKYGHKNR